MTFRFRFRFASAAWVFGSCRSTRRIGIRAGVQPSVCSIKNLRSASGQSLVDWQCAAVSCHWRGCGQGVLVLYMCEGWQLLSVNTQLAGHWHPRTCTQKSPSQPLLQKFWHETGGRPQYVYINNMCTSTMWPCTRSSSGGIEMPHPPSTRGLSQSSPSERLFAHVRGP